MNIFSLCVFTVTTARFKAVLLRLNQKDLMADTLVQQKFCFAYKLIKAGKGQGLIVKAS